MLHWKQIRKKLHRDAIGEQRGPANFLTEQFWSTAFREQGSDGAPTALLVGLVFLAEAGIQAWTGEGELPKEGAHTDLVMAFIRQRLLAMGTLALLLYVC